MSKVLKITPTEYRHACNGAWQTVNDRVVAGNAGSGTYRYVAQFKMNPIEVKASDIIKITLYFYRPETIEYVVGSVNVGCVNNSTIDNTALSTGVPITPSAGYGWKSFNITDLSTHIASFSSAWYLLIGNPSLGTTDTGCAILVSQYTPYLEIECKSGSKIYLASGGTLIPYTLYRAENGVLVPYDIYRGENGTLVKY